MPHKSCDLLIIGGGPAGVTAAIRARELGAKVVLIERTSIGGACTNDGCVPTRFLAHTARLIRNSAQYSDYGLSGVSPALDFEMLMAKTREMVSHIHAKKSIKEHLAALNVEVCDRAGAARFTDSHTVTVETGAAFAGRKILICVGGHARRLPVPGGHLALTHSDVWALTKLPNRLLVVGGAATGCQLASIFNSFGSSVTLVETSDRLIPGEDPSVSEAIFTAFSRRGIRVVTGTGLTQIEQCDDDRKKVTLSGSDGTTCSDFDAVIAAVGWPGNLEELDLPRAGVESERGYIKVSETLQTSAPHIYAAGDITGRMMLVQSARDEGRVATENALRDTDSANEHKIVPHGSFTDPEYGSVGLTEPQALSMFNALSAIVPYLDNDRAVIDSHTEGFCKLIVDPATRLLIGAHVVGQQAVEIVQVAAAAIHAETPIDKLAVFEYAYPTYTSIIGLAARQVLQQINACTGKGSEERYLGDWESEAS